MLAHSFFNCRIESGAGGLFSFSFAGSVGNGRCGFHGRDSDCACCVFVAASVVLACAVVVAASVALVDGSGRVNIGVSSGDGGVYGISGIAQVAMLQYWWYPGISGILKLAALWYWHLRY